MLKKIVCFLLGDKQKQNTPKNWREAMRQEQGNQPNVFYDAVISRRKPYWDEAKKQAFIDVQKLKIAECIPKDVLKDLSDKAVTGVDRTDVTREDIEKYFPTTKKGDLQYIASSIMLTARFFWEKKESQAAGCSLYVWSSACDKHKHLNNLIVDFDVPLPTSITKDDSVIGPIHAGQGYRCTCDAIPIISQSDLPYAPLKMFNGAKIVRVSKKDIVKKFKIEK